MASIISVDLSRFLTDVPYTAARYDRAVNNIRKTEARQARELHKVLVEKVTEQFDNHGIRE